jgi:hypothetical protein
MRHAAELATPETECPLHATYCPAILSELIGAATESAKTNRARAPSGPVKVTVDTKPQESTWLVESPRSLHGSLRAGLEAAVQGPIQGWSGKRS